MIKAVRKTSLIDFPNAVSSVIFTGGCNFSCPYCYNTDLVYKYDEMKTIPEDYVIDLLISRQNFINNVVITGGEPTIHNNIVGFIKKLKKLGFKIKLDTNASCEYIEDILNLIDYVAIDFKAPFGFYQQITNTTTNVELLKKNFELAKNIQHEFRSVIWEKHPFLTNIEEIVKTIGDSPFFLQNVTFIEGFEPLSKIEFDNFLNELLKLKINVKTRAKF